jgi:glycosyltransferase involved in cell wall biosynthesis
VTGFAHCIILPSYNSGSALARTIQAIIPSGVPVWVIIDASTDGSQHALGPMEDSVRVILLSTNGGKGSAVLVGMRAALAAGYTHAVVMDADGQHDVNSLLPFIRISMENADAMVLGVPVFGPDAPPERVNGRRIGNCFANIETHWLGVRDSLFGFRIYPIKQSLRILESIRTARRFDFDTELAVRLVWAGVRPINIETPVFYPHTNDGGVTHFRYLRDNLLLIWTHARLICGMVLRVPRLLRLRKEWT